MKVSVDWLQEYVKFPPPNERVAERLTLAGLEVKKVEPVIDHKDTIFEVEVTSNRPDWLSHFGVAREITAVENLSLKIPEVDIAKNRAPAAGWKIQLKEQEGCPYYTGVLIEGITSHETPEFIKKRLSVCGLRSIDLIVDITNYVLLETGQPLHAFDADLIQGKEIRIRKAKQNEKLLAIDGKELSLNMHDLVIADAENAIALAGVMGGKNSEVTNKTRNIFLESAFFHPRWVRQTVRRYGLTSESSYRFERRVDPEGVDFARERAIFLIRKYAVPRFISSVCKAGEKPVVAAEFIYLSMDDIDKVLGVSIKPHQVVSILTRLGMRINQTSPKSWKVQIPSFRSDLTRPVDLIEEIARIYGYENIPENLPERAPIAVSRNPMMELQNRSRQIFSGIGLNETVTFSLISNKSFNQELGEQSVEIINPQNIDVRWMRPTHLFSLLNVVKKNCNVGISDVFIYEIANIYRKGIDGKHAIEEKVISIALSGQWQPKTWLDPSREITFYDMKGIIEVYLNQLGIRKYRMSHDVTHSLFDNDVFETLIVDNEQIGIFGEVHPKILAAWDLDIKICFAEIQLEKLSRIAQWIRPIKELPKYPSTMRDISVLVSDATKAIEIEKMIWELGQGLISKIEVFDLFCGGRITPGFKSLGFCITYQSHEKTLVSEDVQELHSFIAGEVIKTFQGSFQ